MKYVESKATVGAGCLTGACLLAVLAEQETVTMKDVILVLAIFQCLYACLFMCFSLGEGRAMKFGVNTLLISCIGAFACIAIGSTITF